MSATDFEYAIKKDVRNNPIVREVDEARQRQLLRAVGDRRRCSSRCCCSRPGSTSSCVQHGYLMERMQQERAAEEEVNRHLKLEIETLRAPRRIEEMAIRSCTWSSRTPAPSSSSSEWRRLRLPRSPSSRLGSRSAREEERWRTNTLAGAIPVSVAEPRNLPGAANPARDRARLARHRALAARRRRRALRGLDRRDRGAAALSAGLPARRDGRARRAAAAEHDRARRRGGERSSIATAICSPIPSTPTRSSPTRPRSRTPDTVAATICRALDRCDAAEKLAIAKNLQADRTVRLGGPQGLARRGAAGARARHQGHRVLQGEPPLLPEARIAGSRARIRRARQRRPGWARVSLRRPASAAEPAAS